MDTSPNLALPYIAPQQAQKHVTHNEALRMLDAAVQIGVESRSLTEPPADPGDGERHIVAAGATGPWAAKDHVVAAFQDGAWAYYQPREGWLVWVADEAALLAYDGAGAWIAAAVRSGVPQFGVNTDPDPVNRLAVKSDAVLFSHDDVTPGSGDQRIVVNKEAPAKTASFLFQTAWSGRAEIGMTGDDDFSLKVSPDGVSWHDALTVDRDTGRVAFPSGGVRELLAADRTYHVDAVAGSDTNDGLTGGTAFATIQKAVDTVYGTLDLNGHDVTIQLAAGTHNGFTAVNPQVGAGTIKVKGDTADLEACVVHDQTGSTLVIDVQNSGTRIVLEGLKITRTATASLVRALSGARIEFITANKLAGAGRTHSVMSDVNAYVSIKGSLVVVDAGYTLFYAARNGFLQISGMAADLTAAPALGVLALANNGGILFASASSFSGAATGGFRYAVQTNAIVNTNGGGASYFPNDNAGTTSTGGIYA